MRLFFFFTEYCMNGRFFDINGKILLFLALLLLFWVHRGSTNSNRCFGG